MMSAIEVTGGLSRHAMEKWVVVLRGQTVPVCRTGRHTTPDSLLAGAKIACCYPHPLKKHDGCPPPITSERAQRRRSTSVGTNTLSRRTELSSVRSSRCSRLMRLTARDALRWYL